MMKDANALKRVGAYLYTLLRRILAGLSIPRNHKKKKRENVMGLDDRNEPITKLFYLW